LEGLQLYFWFWCFNGNK